MEAVHQTDAPTPVIDPIPLDITLQMDPSTSHHDRPPPRLGISRRSSANLPRLDSITSFSLTSCQHSAFNLTASNTFLLPCKPDPTVNHERPIAALERHLSNDSASYPGSSSVHHSRESPVIIDQSGGTDRALALEGGRTLPAARHHLEGRGWAFKALFIMTTCSAQLIAQGQFGMVMIPLYEIGAWLGTQNQGQLGWMAASYGLTVGMFLILSGRLGDIYGPKLAWLAGCVLVIVANLASGFCKTQIPFNICRAIGGIGAALSLPNAVAILGRTYPPGRMRSIVFAILGALAPVGFIFAGSIAAVFADFHAVNWIWFTTAIFAAGSALCGIYVLPPDDPIPPRSSRKAFDIVGALLLIAALGLFNFTWNQAPLVGWEVPYVWASLLVSVLLFVSFFLWERRMGRRALIPPQVLSRTSLLVYASLWIGWVSFGTYLFYTVLFIRNIRETHTALGVAAQMAVLGPAGAIAAMLIPTLITKVPGHVIFLGSMLAFFAGNLLMSFAPPNAPYWAVVFPSMILVISGPDMSFSTGQLIVSNSVEREFQGIAAGIVSMITNYSMSIGLGIASTVEVYTAHEGELLKGYRNAFHFATGLAGLAVIIVGLFVRMPKMAQYKE